MSIDVALDALEETVRGFTLSYLISAGSSPHSHVVAVTPRISEGVLHVSDLGRTTRRNVGSNGAVTVLWPPREAGGYSLIVDGRATVDGDGLRVVPGRAVLHRPAPDAPEPVDGSCADDCVELPLPGAARP